VTIDYDLCIGCSYCAVACPYQARYKTDKASFAYGAPLQSSPSGANDSRLWCHQVHFLRRPIDAGPSRRLHPELIRPATPPGVNSSLPIPAFGDLVGSNSNVSPIA